MRFMSELKPTGKAWLSLATYPIVSSSTSFIKASAVKKTKMIPRKNPLVISRAKENRMVAVLVTAKAARTISPIRSNTKSNSKASKTMIAIKRTKRRIRRTTKMIKTMRMKKKTTNSR